MIDTIETQILKMIRQVEKYSGGDIKGYCLYMNEKTAHDLFMEANENGYSYNRFYRGFEIIVDNELCNDQIFFKKP